MAIQKQETAATQFRLAEWFPDLGPGVLTQLKSFNALLSKYNDTIALVSPKTLQTADLTHFADSILGCREIQKECGQSEVYDFGSGNGFPGIIYACLFPASKVVLVDSDQRKCEFLKVAVAELGLKNCKVICSGFDSLPPGGAQFVMCRALAPLTRSLLMGRKPIKTGGCFYHFKGEEWANEVVEIPSQVCSIWQPSLLAEYRLPVGEVKFAIVKCDKLAD